MDEVLVPLVSGKAAFLCMCMCMSCHVHVVCMGRCQCCRRNAGGLDGIVSLLDRAMINADCRHDVSAHGLHRREDERVKKMSRRA